MGLAETLGMETFKGYRETNKRGKLLPLEWQGKTKTLSSIANRLMVQNEYWATPCKKMEWLKCKKRWGDELPKYIPYNYMSQSTELPAIYDGATTFNEFVKKKQKEGTLLIMSWQQVSGHGNPRFYVVAIEFNNFEYNNNKATFKPNKGSYVTGKISVKVGRKSYTIKAARNTFENVPLDAVWIKCNTCETFSDSARRSLNDDIQFRLPKKKGRRERRRSSRRSKENEYESKYNDDDESLESQLKF